MNPSSDTGGASFTGASGTGKFPQPPANWREALMALIASRVALIQLESKDVAKAGIRSAIYLAATFVCVLSTWALFLAGGIALVSELTRWPWSLVALSAAALHLLAAFILVRLAKPKGTPAFPVTRSEFQKDREWIENFQKTKSSNS
ncbi:phage holin family protein [Luteolibacter yonseiensis]|uniref:Phage holin family protein n=1 Tax=Luteolibacter yonseiensis TaxID=1144680 RepID=A0A934R6S2_9BACT|nr:phage holin family protein [Luteolibacter yonseiensis]MBK1818336.1 phage holin family protein [Luteolibacter yonseiensis]